MSVLTARTTAREAQRYQLDTGLGELTPAERAARGKEARAARQVPADAGNYGKQRDFCVRQLRDWKYSIAIEALIPRGMRIYGEVCGWALARAHACSGDRIAIAAYLGGSDVFDKAITQFASAYADQNERDHQALVDAVTSGRLTAEPDM